MTHEEWQCRMAAESARANRESLYVGRAEKNQNDNGEGKGKKGRQRSYADGPDEVPDSRQRTRTATRVRTMEK